MGGPASAGALCSLQRVLDTQPFECIAGCAGRRLSPDSQSVKT